MSNISRRDFLKTAGVMTLAVAAAGVLAGCEGNAAKPEVPETGAKALGEVTKVGKFEFTVNKAVLAEVYTSTSAGPNDAVVTEENRKLALVFAVKQTEKDTNAAFTTSNVKVYVNGKPMTLAAGTDTFTAEALGMDERPAKFPDATIAANETYKAEATSYQFVAETPKSEYTGEDDKFVAVTSIKVVVNDPDKSVYTTYDVPVPAMDKYAKLDEFYKA